VLAHAEGRSGLCEQLAIVWEAASRRGRGEPLQEAAETFATVHSRLVAVLTELPDATLGRLWRPAYPDSLAAHIARNTYRHYGEHLPLITERWASRGASNCLRSRGKPMAPLVERGGSRHRSGRGSRSSR
jgi:hypothetical protein